MSRRQRMGGMRIGRQHQVMLEAQRVEFRVQPTGKAQPWAK